MSIRGAGALHTWTSADGQEFVIGDKTRNPHVWIRKLNGRHSKPEMDDNRDVKIGATGEIPRLSSLRGKTEAWEIVIDADTLVDQVAIRDAFINAFTDPREGTMEIATHPNYEDGPYVYNARCLSADVPDEHGAMEHRPWARNATLTLRLSDPRYYENYWREAVSSPLTPDNGLSLPVTLPTTISAPSFRPGTVTLDAGEAPVDPIIEFTGPARAPSITNESTGQGIYFRTLDLRAGQTVVIDFAARTVMLDGESIRSQITWAQSGWFDANVFGLKRGVNTLRYLAVGYGTGAQIKVRWRRASFG
jgi:hypothetical protein